MFSFTMIYAWYNHTFNIFNDSLEDTCVVNEKQWVYTNVKGLWLDFCKTICACFTRCKIIVFILVFTASWNCPTNWNKQYSGYLMAEPSGKKKSQSNYICVNSYAGFIRNGDQTPHARLAYVEVGCHSSGLIPCSTYPNGRELTCVVCVR